jgi:uncharacterized protein YycO
MLLNKKIKLAIILTILLISVVIIIVGLKGRNSIDLTNIKPGDIIVTCSIETPIPGHWHHTSIYIGNGSAIGSFYGGVITYPIEYLKYKSQVMILRVNTSDEIRERAVEFAESKVGYPFNWMMLDKKQGNSYYCSELIWAAYYNASNWKINLDSIDTVSNTPIFPDDIASSNYTEKIASSGSYCFFPPIAELIVHVYQNYC